MAHPLFCLFLSIFPGELVVVNNCLLSRCKEAGNGAIIDEDTAPINHLKCLFHSPKKQPLPVW